MIVITFISFDILLFIIASYPLELTLSQDFFQFTFQFTFGLKALGLSQYKNPFKIIYKMKGNTILLMDNIPL